MAEPTPSCQDLVQDLPQAIVGLGSQGQVDHMNSAAGQLLEVKPEQARGQEFSQVFADRLGRGEELFKTIAAAQSKGTSLDGLVIPLEISSGQTVHVSLHTRPMPGGGLAVMMQDVSRQEEDRQVQQKQRALAAELALKAEQKFNRLEQSLKRHKRLRLWIALVVIVLFAGLGYWAWTRTHLVSLVDKDLGQPSPGQAQHGLYTLKAQPLSSSISLSGSVEAFNTINLLSPFAGRILERHFEYGQKVKKGGPAVEAGHLGAGAQAPGRQGGGHQGRGELPEAQKLEKQRRGFAGPARPEQGGERPGGHRAEAAGIVHALQAGHHSPG